MHVYSLHYIEHYNNMCIECKYGRDILCTTLDTMFTVVLSHMPDFGSDVGCLIHLCMRVLFATTLPFYTIF